MQKREKRTKLNEVELFIIKETRNKSFIWDINDEKYFVRKERTDCYNSIATDVKCIFTSEWINTSGESVQLRWKYLRDQYSEMHKRFLNGTTISKLGEQILQQLNFLNPFISHKTPPNVRNTHLTINEKPSCSAAPRKVDNFPAENQSQLSENYEVLEIDSSDDDEQRSVLQFVMEDDFQHDLKRMKIEYLQEYEAVVMQKCVNKPQQTVDYEKQCKQKQLEKSEDLKSKFVAKIPQTEESIDFINFSNNIGQVDHGRGHSKQQIVDHENQCKQKQLEKSEDFISKFVAKKPRTEESINSIVNLNNIIGQLKQEEKNEAELEMIVSQTKIICSLLKSFTEKETCEALIRIMKIFKK